MRISLETPVLKAIGDPTYENLMYSIPGTVGVNIWRVALQNAENVFGVQETVGEAWNKVVGLPAIYCGKRHEIDGSGIVPCRCINRNNACCGHPQETRIFHAYGLAGMIAMKIDHTIIHPGIILRGLVGMDLEASDAYGTLGDDAEGIDPRFIPEIKKEIEKKEKKFFLETTLPWRQKVAEALMSIAEYN